jgi:hypothetical protein
MLDTELHHQQQEINNNNVLPTTDQHQHQLHETVGTLSGTKKEQTFSDHHLEETQNNNNNTGPSFFMTEGDDDFGSQNLNNTRQSRTVSQQQQNNTNNTTSSQRASNNFQQHNSREDPNATVEVVASVAASGTLPSAYGQPMRNVGHINYSSDPVVEGRQVSSDERDQQHFMRQSAGATLRSVVTDLRRALRQPLPPLPL